MMCYLNRGSTFYFRFIIIKGIGVRPIPFCTYLSIYFNLFIALNIGQYNESSYHAANTASQ